LPAITVAAVIPTLNEEEALRRYLEAALQWADEVIVSDGGSTDSTREMATSMGATLVTGARGRGPQLNLGAKNAHSDVLLFLHADTQLPPDGIEEIRIAVRNGHIGGGFRAVFDDPRPLLRFGSQLVNLRTRLTGMPLGDQAQFATREAFRQLGGFRDWPILEDIDFMRRLKTSGRTAVISPPVITSARRYTQNGVFKTIGNNWWIWILFSIGVSPEKLERRYRQVR
jgi:rSAM/selenodomain-associated transferase 2